MERLIFSKLNGTARSIAMGECVSAEEINSLIDWVMDYMLSTGNSFIRTDFLSVDVDFIEAKIKSFFVCDDAGRNIDLKNFTQKFSDQLTKNQKQGMKRLYEDIFKQNTNSHTQKVLIFGKN